MGQRYCSRGSKSKMTWAIGHCPREGATQVVEVRWPRKLSLVKANRHFSILQVEGQAVGGEDGEKRPQVFPVMILGLAVNTVII